MAINATEQESATIGFFFFYVGLRFYLSLPCLFKIVLGGRYNHV